MKMFYSTKTYGHEAGLSCAFRQPGATHSHCSLIHGYALSFSFTFAATELDDKNWAVDFGDLGALKVTTDKFYRINGLTTQLEGVKSDIIFPDRYSMVEMGEKDQDNPLSWDRITPALYKPLPKLANYDYSVERSKRRIEENPFVALIKDQAAWIKKQQDDSRFYLDYESFKFKRESNKK